MQRPRGIVGEQHQERIVQGQKIICGLVWANSFGTICSQEIWIVLVEAEPAPGLKAKLKALGDLGADLSLRAQQAHGQRAPL